MSAEEVESKSGSEGEEEVDHNDLGNSDIVAKYRFAADVANRALEGVITQCVADKPVVEICSFGDEVIKAAVASSYKSKKIDKGVAFPTCISVNETVCHYSPLAEESVTLKAGDTVRIDLGAHVDGYIAQVAHTIRVPGAAAKAEEAKGEEASTDSLGDVVVAAHNAIEIATRLCAPGKKNSDVTAALAKVAGAYGVNLVQGTLSHQVKRFVIDGNKTILQKEDVENKVEEFEFQVGEAYCLDVCFSTGDGKPKETGTRTTIFKRAVDEQYRLKMKASRYVFNEVNKSFPTLPFTIRSLEDVKQARMGVVECVKHELLQPYPVLSERAGAQVAHFKATVLILETGTAKITGMALPEGDAAFTSEKTLPEDMAAVMAAGGLKKKRRRGKKKGGAGGGGGGGADA